MFDCVSDYSLEFFGFRLIFGLNIVQQLMEQSDKVCAAGVRLLHDMNIRLVSLMPLFVAGRIRCSWIRRSSWRMLFNSS